jgi:hypothetical protein
MAAADTATTSALCALKKMRPTRIVSRASGESN